MGGSPELAYLTSLRDPSPSSTFQRSSLMGQDTSGCAECSSGCWVCRHLVAGARCPAWRSGIAGERMGSCVVLEVARTGRGQLRPPEPSCPTWRLTGVSTACWSLVRVGQHAQTCMPVSWTSKQPLLSHGAVSACGLRRPLLSSRVPTVPPCDSSMCSSAPMLQSHQGLGAPCGWWPPCMGPRRAEVTWQGSLRDGACVGRPWRKSVRARLRGHVRSSCRRWVVDTWQQQQRLRTSLPPSRHGEDTW